MKARRWVERQLKQNKGMDTKEGGGEGFVSHPVEGIVQMIPGNI